MSDEVYFAIPKKVLRPTIIIIGKVNLSPRMVVPFFNRSIKTRISSKKSIIRVFVSLIAKEFDDGKNNPIMSKRFTITTLIFKFKRTINLPLSKGLF